MMAACALHYRGEKPHLNLLALGLIVGRVEGQQRRERELKGPNGGVGLGLQERAELI